MTKAKFTPDLGDESENEQLSPESNQEAEAINTEVEESPKPGPRKAPQKKVPVPILPDDGNVANDLPDMVKTASVRQPDKNTPYDFRSGKAQSTERLFASIGLSRPMLPPLTRKRTAIYQLVNFKNVKDKRLEGIDQFVDPQPYELVPNYTITDEYEPDLGAREKTMTYFEGGTEMVSVKDPLTGKDKMVSVPKIGQPRFEGGQVVIDIYKAYNRYVWWELHPRNASNKRRNRQVAPIFERVDIKHKNVHAQTIEQDLKFEAERYVREMSLDALIKLASALVNPTIDTRSNRPDDLRLILRQRAQANPTEVLNASNIDTSAAIKFHIIDALNLGIMSYFSEYNAYFYGDEQEAFFTVPHDNDPLHSVAMFFRSTMEGKQIYDKVKSDLGFWI